MPIFLALFLAFAVVGPAAALDSSQPTAATVVKGDVLYWEDEELVVKEMSGREARLRVTSETKLEGVVSRLKTGDKITAQLTPDGRTLSITLQIPESGAGAISPVPR